MTLMETIVNDMKESMKTQDKFSLGVYRMLKSALQLEQINLKHELSDTEIQSVIKKQVKVRKDSILEYENYQRMDLVDGLKQEVSILSKYLPEELSQEKILEEIHEVFSSIKPTSMKDMGRVMKVLTERIGTQADMSLVSSLVKEEISKL